MLIKREHLEGIKAGRLSLAFRRWRRPTARAGGRLRTAVGELAVDAVDVVTEATITRVAARRAEFSSRDELLAELRKKRDGLLYRIRLRFAGPEPRVALRQKTKVSLREFKELENTFRRLDSNINHGPWTIQTLRNIATHPDRPAGELAAAIRGEKGWLKLINPKTQSTRPNRKSAGRISTVAAGTGSFKKNRRRAESRRST